MSPCGLCSGDSAGSASGFLLSGGSFRNLRGRQGGGSNAKRVNGKDTQRRMTKSEREGPEEQLLSSLLLDDVQLVVVAQSTGHFLIGHVVPIL